MSKEFYSKWKKLCKDTILDEGIKHARLKYCGDRINSENDWHRIRNPLRMLYTAFVFQILGKTPPCRIKNAVYRMFGVKIGKEVAIAYNVFLDPLFPELITIDDGVMIGSDVEIATHEFVPRWFAMGRVRIGKNCMVAAYNIISPGVTMGAGSFTGLYSFVKADIPEKEFWAGIPAKLIKKMGTSDLVPKKDLEITRY
ncbi:MAG: acyltransferase [archaeon]